MPPRKKKGNKKNTEQKLRNWRGGKYKGDWKAGQPDGHGVHSYNVGGLSATYDGEWKRGRYHGQGMLTRGDGNIYTGEWENDMKHGYGTETWADGTKYEGQYENDRRHGRGGQIWPDGRRYVGGWYNGFMHGNGILDSGNGSRYEGGWREGLRYGMGRETYSDGTVYEGMFEGDDKNGRGREMYPDGSSYEGEWEGDAKHGEGIETNQLGVSYRVTYHNGHGIRTYSCANCGGESQYPPFKACAQCLQVRYCSRKCQKEDWARHKPECIEMCKIRPAAPEGPGAGSVRIRGMGLNLKLPWRKWYDSESRSWFWHNPQTDEVKWDESDYDREKREAAAARKSAEEKRSFQLQLEKVLETKASEAKDLEAKALEELEAGYEAGDERGFRYGKLLTELAAINNKLNYYFQN